MQGTVKNISLLRRLIIDLMHASRDVPFVSLTRTLQYPAADRGPGRARPAARLCRDLRQGIRDGGPRRADLRTLYAKWPRPCFYELPRNVAMVAIARVENGEHCVLPQRVCQPRSSSSLTEVDA